jgi:hypothetical protein
MEEFVIKFALATRPVHVPVTIMLILSIHNATSLYKKKAPSCLNT